MYSIYVYMYMCIYVYMYICMYVCTDMGASTWTPPFDSHAIEYLLVRSQGLNVCGPFTSVFLASASSALEDPQVSKTRVARLI